MGVRQPTIIFGTLLIAFVIYITVRGQLPGYLAVFTGAATGEGDVIKESGSSVKKSVDNITSSLPPFLRQKVDELFSNSGII